MEQSNTRLWNAVTGPAEGYEPGTVRAFNQILSEGDQVIIAGAHQGYFVGVCSRLVGKTGKVFGFEPEPKNFSILSDSVNGLDNVELFNFALGSKKAVLPFFFNSDNDGGHALWDVSKYVPNVESQKNPIVIQTEVKTIDDMFEDRDMSHLKLLMLDTEGSEHDILRGGINTIVDNELPYIICEINPPALHQCGTSQMELRNYLSVNGYSAYWLDLEKAVDIGRGEWGVEVNGGKVVFNILFSRRGKV